MAGNGKVKIDDAHAMIDAEIEWSNGHVDWAQSEGESSLGVSAEQLMWYIRGLEQAKRLIIGTRDATPRFNARTPPD